MRVYQGDKEGKKQAASDMIRWILVYSGTLEYTVYLNGGSNTRKETRQYYVDTFSKEFYVEVTGWSVTIRSRNDIE